MERLKLEFTVIKTFENRDSINTVIKINNESATYINPLQDQYYGRSNDSFNLNNYFRNNVNKNNTHYEL